MGDKTRQVPNPEWVLMYRCGLTRTRIAALVGAPASKVGYHLTVARVLNPGIANEHEALALNTLAPKVRASGIARMNELIEFVTAEGKYPSAKAETPEERRLGLWLQRQRRRAAAGSLAPAVRDGLQALPGWETNTRSLADESRWQERLAALIDYRANGEDWPRHKKTANEEEHTLGVWLHAQRSKHARGELSPAQAAALNDALPGWREGRRRGRKPGQ